MYPCQQQEMPDFLLILQEFLQDAGEMELRNEREPGASHAVPDAEAAQLTQGAGLSYKGIDRRAFQSPLSAEAHFTISTSGQTCRST